MPTEAEWEYACRAGTTTPWSFGDADIGNYAWYVGNAGSKTHQVGLKLPNAFGLYDMHGNVCEWCWDRYGTYVDNPPNENPKGDEMGTYRVMRGGGWSDSADGTCSAGRGYYNPIYRVSYIGFRLVRQ